jgi:hypothetical protein
LLGQRNKKSDEKEDLNVRDDTVTARGGKSFPTIPLSKAKMSVMLEFAPIL